MQAKKGMKQLRAELRQEYENWLKSVPSHADPVDYIGWLEIEVIGSRGLLRDLIPPAHEVEPEA